MTGAPSAKLLAAKLWEKTSAAGNRYFTGRLGGVKILILDNRDRGGEDDPTHHLFFVDGAKPAEPTQRGVTPVRRQQRQGRQSQPPVRPDSVPMPDDSVDDLYRGPAP